MNTVVFLTVVAGSPVLAHQQHSNTLSQLGHTRFLPFNVRQTPENQIDPSLPSPRRKMLMQVRKIVGAEFQVRSEGAKQLVEVYPLGLCEGDCDKDEDCAGDLVCFQRGANEEVPGCEGGEKFGSATDFCTEAISIPTPIPIPTEVPSDFPSPIPPSATATPFDFFIDIYPEVFTYEVAPPVGAFPLGLCQGDCDDDGDCEGNLICFERDPFEGVPGCRGGANVPSKTDFCVDPTAENVTMTPSSSSYPSEIPSALPSAIPSTSEEPSLPVPLFVYQSEPPASAFPLPLCHGDCDDDSDCDEGLICFERERNEEVPGCKGGAVDNSLTDYCTYPWPTSQPIPAPSPPPSAPSISNASSSSSQSPSTLPKPTQSPSLRPTSAPFLRPTASPSTQPTSAPTAMTPEGFVPIFAYDELNPPSSVLPLDLCTGDCDSDQECGEGLFCYQRNAGEDVPGCLGGANDSTDRDFCARIEFAPVKPSNSTFFRLRVDNQGSKDWCMACENGCVVGDQLYLRQCSGRSTYFELIDLGFGESLIEASGTGLCLERREDLVDFRVCNSAKTRQRFIASDDSDLATTASFELTQFGRRSACISPSTASFAAPVSMGLCSDAQSNGISVWSKV